ncbi:MAG: exodeoxyribonuclease III [Gammaproteobacteria bacterium]
MRVITMNVNGIRSAERKGFFRWMVQQNPDVVCLQEIKAKRAQLPSELVSLPGYHSFFHDADKPGYSGVALYTRRLPNAVTSGLGWADFDAEGRYLQVDFGDLRLISLYLPSGSSSPERQAKKFQFMDRLLPVLAALSQDGRDYILCGDWNIAHKNIDLKNWRGNQKNSGFLAEERAWLDVVFDQIGLVDAFRVLNQEAEQYTWWSNRGQAWSKNVGWRIDYQVVTPALASKIEHVAIYTDRRFSDHAPLTVDYTLTLPYKRSSSVQATVSPKGMPSSLTQIGQCTSLNTGQDKLG